MLKLLGENCRIKSAENVDGERANVIMCDITDPEMCPKKTHKNDLEPWCFACHI